MVITTQRKKDVNEELIEQLLSESNPNELFGKDGLFNFTNLRN